MGGPEARKGKSRGGRSRVDAGGRTRQRRPDDQAQTEPDADPESVARSIALRKLSAAPQTRAQLDEAMQRKAVPEDVRERVLGRFSDVGLIDDAMFAKMWVESRHAGRGLAKKALAHELRRRGVDSAVVDDAVGELPAEQEEAKARELVARRLRSTRGLEPERRTRRLAGMLARKGYPAGLAFRVIREALEGEGVDEEHLPDEATW